MLFRRAAVVLAVVPLMSLAAQDEASLRKAFEGQAITMKIDMPATSSGVNVHPLRATPLEFPDLARRLKEHGTAIKRGESILVTKVLVKKDLIEFQLGGGGYGTFGDAVAQPSLVGRGIQGKTRREEDLERRIRAETDRAKRRELERELDDLRRTRERDNARLVAEQQQAQQAANAALRERKLAAGSRFNIRYDGGVPASALTPDALRAALAQYVAFDGAGSSVATPSSAAAPAPPRGGATALRKGMSVAEVEALLGPAISAARTTRDGLQVSTREYETGGQRVVTSFVSGVLVDYAITPLDGGLR